MDSSSKCKKYNEVINLDLICPKTHFNVYPTIYKVHSIYIVEYCRIHLAINTGIGNSLNCYSSGSSHERISFYSPTICIMKLIRSTYSNECVAKGYASLHFYCILIFLLHFMVYENCCRFPTSCRTLVQLLIRLVITILISRPSLPSTCSFLQSRNPLFFTHLFRSRFTDGLDIKSSLQILSSLQVTSIFLLKKHKFKLTSFVSM